MGKALTQNNPLNAHYTETFSWWIMHFAQWQTQKTQHHHHPHHHHHHHHVGWPNAQSTYLHTLAGELWKRKAFWRGKKRKTEKKAQNSNDKMGDHDQHFRRGGEVVNDYFVRSGCGHCRLRLFGGINLRLHISKEDWGTSKPWQRLETVCGGKV